MLLMNSGAYRVQTAYCTACNTTVGWKFLHASERSEKWKEGYHVVELDHLREVTSPLSPLDPPQADFKWHRLSDNASAHKRSASVSPAPSVLQDRPSQRPMGPRERRNS